MFQAFFFLSFLSFLFHPPLPFLSQPQVRLHLCRRRKLLRRCSAAQEQEVGDTPQRGVAALCWKGKKQLLSATGADAALAWLFFFFLLLFFSDDKLAKGGGDTAVSSFSSVELSHTATSSAKLGKVCATLSLSRRRSFMQKSCDLPNAIGGLNCTISFFFFFSFPSKVPDGGSWKIEVRLKRSTPDVR